MATPIILLQMTNISLSSIFVCRIDATAYVAVQPRCLYADCWHSVTVACVMMDEMTPGPFRSIASCDPLQRHQHTSTILRRHLQAPTSRNHCNGGNLASLFPLVFVFFLFFFSCLKLSYNATTDLLALQ